MHTLIARRSRSIQLAAAFIIEHDIRQLPLNPKELIHRCGWHLKRYSDIVRTYPGRVTLKELCELLQSADAATILTGSQYTIVYNDRSPYPERTTFSLCHEIGHIILEHFLDYDFARLSPEDKKALETEADIFASNLLCPVGVMPLLRNPNSEKTREIFGVSKSAWQHRLIALDGDKLHVSRQVIEQHQRQFFDFMYTRQCPVCQRVFVSERQETCTHCTSQRLGWKVFEDKKPAAPTISPERWELVIMPMLRGHFAELDRMEAEARQEEWNRQYRLFKQGKPVRLFEWDPFNGENPMVIDELWEPRKHRRRRANGKHCSQTSPARPRHP